MPYAFLDNSLAIAEQQFSSGPEVRFTLFDSCLGLLGRNGNVVTGVHLVMVGDPSEFDNATADRAVQALGVCTQVVVIGQIGAWSDGLEAAYLHLISRLHDPIAFVPVDNGTYGGRVNNGVFQTYRNGNYVNV